MLRRLLIHTSTYSIASVLIALAGLVSFPIFTRLFSVGEYGLLNLVSSALGFLVGLGKLGLQTSIVRFYPEVASGKSDFSESGLLSTALIGMLVTGVCVTAVVLVIVAAAPASIWPDPRMPDLMLLTAALIVVRVVDSGLINILRAQQRSGAFAIYSVARRYGALAIILFVVFHVLPGLYGFYLGTILAEALAVFVLTFILLRARPLKLAEFSPPLFRSMLAFGLPMVAFEMGGLLLAYGDRYVIQLLLGAEAVGIYSAAYNLSEYVQIALLSAFGTAVTPMFTRIWAKDGAVATARFISIALHFYVVAAVAVGFGMAALGSDALTLLASKKYLPGAVIIPWVIAGMVIDGASSLLGAGLYLHKRSKTVMVMMLCTASLNIGLNFILIPRMGISGSAVATLISLCAMTIAVTLGARQFLRIEIPWLHILKIGACGMATYLLTVRVSHDTLLLAIGLKLAVAGVTYALLVVSVDRRTRDIVKTTWARLRTATGPGAAPLND